MGNSIGNKTETALEGVAFAQIFFSPAFTWSEERAFVGDLNSFSLTLLVLFCCVLSVIKGDVGNNNYEYLHSMLLKKKCIKIAQHE